jgi:EpsI family protein
MKTQARMGLRFVVAATLIAATAAFVHGRGHDSPSPPHKSVTDFPRTVGDWQGGEAIPFSEETLQVLGPGEFLEREYQHPAEPLIDFLLEYFPSQRQGDTIHSPKHCLPGAGWEPVQSTSLWLKGPDGRSLPVNYYVLAKGEDRQVVLYWYQSHGRALASEYWAKIYLVWDAIRLNRTDGSMIRVITPVAQNESVENAKDRAVGFAEKVLPMLGAYIPS